MKTPNLYYLEELRNDRFTNYLKFTKKINGNWVPTRPLGFYSFWWRLRMAWLAFSGQCDLVRWPEGQ